MTTLYMINAAHGTFNYNATTIEKKLVTSGNANGVVNGTCTTVNGPVNSVTVPVISDATGNWFVWVTNPLAAVDLTGTNFTANLRMAESSMNANCGAAILFESYTHAQVLSSSAYFEKATELGTTEAAQNWTATFGNFSIPDNGYLAVWVGAGDSNVNSVAGFTATFWYDGANGATGDSWVSTASTLTDWTPPPMVPINTAYYQAARTRSWYI